MSDLRYRYAGSSLGVFWNVLTPAAMLALYTFLFTHILAGRFVGGLSTGLFVLYLASGFLPWGVFTDSVMRGSSALVANGVYLRKTAIPEQVFIAQVATSGTLGMGIVLVLLVGLALVLGQPAQLTWLLLPLAGVFWEVLAFGVGLVLGALNVFFRDIPQLLGVGFQFWMWSLPVVYLEDYLPMEYRSLLVLNPGYPYLRAVRELYLGTGLPEGWVWGLMFGWAGLAVACGLLVMRRLRSEIRDAL